MKILVIGGGGREHALVWKLAQSPRVRQIFCAPGNAGIAEKAECVAIAANDIPALLEFAKSNQIDLTIVGPEDPLSLGIVDIFQAEGLAIFGPTQKAARLESSKIFTKEFSETYNIPQAPFKIFDNPIDAKSFLERTRYPLVLKADGLAQGKGVVICKNLEEALIAVDRMMVQQTFGDAGKRILIEEFLNGEEVSFIALCDGKHAMSLATAKDHKRLMDRNQGPNTGGMGAFSPSPLVTPHIYNKIMQNIIEPTLRGMAKAGNPFTGFLYAGLMLCGGEPRLLEFNTRLGDPEAQVLLTRLKNDLVELILAALAQRLDQIEPSWETRVAACIVMASQGYPEKYEKGFPIKGLDKVKPMHHVQVFHGGTLRSGEHCVTAGGRVLGVTALGEDLKQALQEAYEAVHKISWEGCFYRTDIGRS